MDHKQKFSNRALSVTPGIIEEVFKFAQNKDIIFLASGTPDVSLLPFEVLEKLTKAIFQKYGNKILQYGSIEGFIPLKEAIFPLLKKRYINSSVDCTHISTGSQGAINNICMVLLDKGDTVVVESPSYSGAINSFRAYQANVVGVTTDDFGMIPDSLEEQLKDKPVKFIYLVPTFQNPTGNSINLDRRRKIAEIAKKYNTLIIEDDAYYDLRYKGENLPSVYHFAPDNVVYIGSFSKIFSPAMRLAYVIAPKEISKKMLTIKQILDLNSSSYTQALTTEFINQHYLDKHLETIKKVYYGRLLAMLHALNVYMPTGFSWSKPEGGIFIWVTGPTEFDANKLFLKAIDKGVAIIPGTSFYSQENKGMNTFRLSFATTSEENINNGIKILSNIIG